MTDKCCTGCKKKTKLFSEFSKNKFGRNGLQPKCKECLLQQQRNRRAIVDNTTYRYRYGKTVQELNEIKIAQQNKCAICKNDFTDSFNTVVDHCHKTNKFRGFLCRKCNSGLGLFRDNPTYLQEAIKYLSMST